MKKFVQVFLIVLLLGLSSCQQISLPEATTADSTQVAKGITAVVSTAVIEKGDQAPIEPYQDVRNQNYRGLKFDLDKSVIATLWYNESTSWPSEYAGLARNILEQGKNPGLGVKKLHEQGITGVGVNVAIIDQNLVPDHPEFEGRIIKYHDVGTYAPSNEGSMHGPAVASLLVGENTGTAPGANLYYVAAPSWTGDAQYQANALNWLVDENEKLPDGEKIRVVSVSAAPSGPDSLFTNQEAWDLAYGRATAAGILVLDCTTHRGITAACYYDLDDPDNIAKCIPGWPGLETLPFPDRIYIPTSHRTTAEEYYECDFSYQYTGRGGSSWSVPYLTGVLALGWQVRPELTSSQMLQILYESAYVTDDGLKIINPGAFIDMVKLAAPGEK